MTIEGPSGKGVDPHLRPQRRMRVAESAHLCGVDRAEWQSDGPGRCTIDIHFIASAHAGKSAIPPTLTKSEIFVSGLAEDHRRYPALHLHRHAPGTAVLRVDFPPSALFTEGMADGSATVSIRHPEVDPLLSAVVVRFAPKTSLDRDPVQANAMAVPSLAADVNYLAKDFESYRQLMLDQMTVLLPGWRERHPADMGNAIVEILAYAADSLSYYQDAVATEAYLSTARRRVSLKRHARLLDYPVHDGCAARAWIQVRTSDPATLKAGLVLVCDEMATLNSAAVHVSSRQKPPSDGSAAFETMVDAALHPELDRMDLYHWGADDFRLAAGATSAALAGHFDMLDAGDVLILIEALNPLTGEAATADTTRRHPVRLLHRPHLGVDPLHHHKVTEIVWSDEDALPFELSIVRSSGGRRLEKISVALGNIVPADIGFTLTDPVLQVPPDDEAGDFQLPLVQPDLIYAVAYDAATARRQPAAAFSRLDPATAAPAVTVRQTLPYGAEQIWHPTRDLLRSERFSHDFVAETETDGTTSLRFGNDRNGAAPTAGSRLRATYRIGPSARNVGAGSISSWSPRPGDAFVIGVWNPLPAAGGLARQSAEQIRFHAPGGFRSQHRCVIAEDFVDLVSADPRVQAAVAEERWAGSWNRTIVHVQPTASAADDPALFTDLAAQIEPRRIIGGQFGLQRPHYVPLQIELAVTVKTPFSPMTVQGNISAAIRTALGFGTMSFGQTIYLSPIVAAAMAEPGVTDVQVRAFQRLGKPAAGEIARGQIVFGPYDIPLLDDRSVDGVRGLLIVRADLAQVQ